MVKHPVEVLALFRLSLLSDIGGTNFLNGPRRKGHQ